MKLKLAACVPLILILSCQSLKASGLETTPSESDSLSLPESGADLALPAAGDSLVLGYSALGNPLCLYRFGPGGSSSILVIGGVHGNEPEGAAFARALADSLSQMDANSIPHDVFILPLLNPDGMSANTRKNANGVDLNRNFPTRDFAVGDSQSVYFGGREPLSEPETKLLQALIERVRPTVLVSLHSPLKCVNYDGDAHGLAASLAEAMGLPLKEDIGYATPGSLGTYYGKERGLPVITVEFAAGDAAWPASCKAFLETLLPVQPGSR